MVNNQCFSLVHPAISNCSRSEQALWQGGKCFHLSIWKVLFQSEKSLKLSVPVSAFEMSSFWVKLRAAAKLVFLWGSEEHKTYCIFPGVSALFIVCIHVKALALAPSLVQLITPPAAGLGVCSSCSMMCELTEEHTLLCRTMQTERKPSRNTRERGWGSMWLHDLSCWIQAKACKNWGFQFYNR